MVRGGLAVGEDFFVGVHHVSVCVCISKVTSFEKSKHIKKSNKCVVFFVLSLDHLVSHGIVSKTIAFAF